MFPGVLCMFPLTRIVVQAYTGNIEYYGKITGNSPNISGKFTTLDDTTFYQRVSIVSYASAGIARAEMSVCPSVRPSVTLRYCIKTKKASVMISSPSESLNILVSRNIWFITKFHRGHPERGRFLRQGWVRTGDFGDFSTNKPPYLRNGAR